MEEDHQKGLSYRDRAQSRRNEFELEALGNEVNRVSGDYSRLVVWLCGRWLATDTSRLTSLASVRDCLHIQVPFAS